LWGGLVVWSLWRYLSVLVLELTLERNATLHVRTWRKRYVIPVIDLRSIKNHGRGVWLKHHAEGPSLVLDLAAEDLEDLSRRLKMVNESIQIRLQWFPWRRQTRTS
jgi:hypothetical protein